MHDTTPDGRLLGRADIRHTGTLEINGFDFFYFTLCNRGGKENFCFVFRGENKNDVVSLDWFNFY